MATSRIGRTLAAIRDSEAGAESVGVRVRQHKLMVFSIGAFIAGLGGSLLGQQVGGFDGSSFITFNSLLWFAVVVVAGIRSVTGALVAAFIFTMLGTVVGDAGVSILVVGIGAVSMGYLGGGLVEVGSWSALRCSNPVVALVWPLCRGRSLRRPNRRRSSGSGDGEVAAACVAPQVCRGSRVVTVLLQIEQLSKSFGGLQAVSDVSFDAPAGQVTSLIGPNGAGKTTLFNCLTGLERPDHGRVVLDGNDLTDVPVPERARAGLGRTFQRLEVFTGMTVADNLRVAAEAQRTRGWVRELLGLSDPSRPATEQLVRDSLAATDLADVAQVLAGSLSTGTLRRLELARALCTSPRVLLLDEPASGLDAAETGALGALLVRLADAGLGVVLIEHDIELVLAVSEHVVVLDRGTVIASGDPASISDDPAVRTAYLGAERAQSR